MIHLSTLSTRCSTVSQHPTRRISPYPLISIGISYRKQLPTSTWALSSPCRSLPAPRIRQFRRTNALVSRPPVRDRRRQPGIPNSVEEPVGMQLANIKQLAEATAGERISTFSSMSSSGAYGLYGPPLADAWVLDWSQSPPLWSPIQSLSNTAATASGSAPNARFAHSAVSYGNNILLAFGWTGNNAAETSLWVWDGIQASMDAGANTVGGFWIGSSSSEATSGGVGSVPSYTPDPNSQPLSNGLGWSPSSSSGSKGPSGNSPSQTGSGQPSSSAADLEFGFVSPKATGELKSVDTHLNLSTRGASYGLPDSHLIQADVGLL
ncbi:hypothetical protein CF335_g8282 [Tilletia laevis]|nr:hypothetical protein CF335_g8282 [Tilletia laevis]